MHESGDLQGISVLCLDNDALILQGLEQLLLSMGANVTTARNRVQSVIGVGESSYAALTVASPGDAVTRFHVIVDVDDRPGVLAAVASIFAANDVAMEMVRQELRREQDAERGIVLVRGAIPGPRGALVVIRTAAKGA